MTLGSPKFQQWLIQQNYIYKNEFIGNTVQEFNIKDITVSIKDNKITFCQLFINTTNNEINYLSFNDNSIYFYTQLMNLYDKKYDEIEKYILNLINMRMIYLDDILSIKLLVLYIVMCSGKQCYIIDYFKGFTFDRIKCDKLSYKMIERNDNDIIYDYYNPSWRNLFVTNEISNLVKANISPNFLILYDWSFANNTDHIICIMENYSQGTLLKSPTILFELFYSLYVIHSKLEISNLVYTIVMKQNVTYCEDSVNVYITSEKGEYDTYVFPCLDYTYCLQIVSYTDGLEYIDEDFKTLSNILNVQIGKDFLNHFHEYKFTTTDTDKKIANIYNFNRLLIKEFKKIRHLNY